MNTIERIKEDINKDFAVIGNIEITLNDLSEIEFVTQAETSIWKGETIQLGGYDFICEHTHQFSVDDVFFDKVTLVKF